MQTGFSVTSLGSPPDVPSCQQKCRLAVRACGRGDFQQALQLYDEAIVCWPTSHVLYCNRSAVHLRLNQCERAHEDACTACHLQPRWPKSWLRKGSSLIALKRFDEAFRSLCQGLSLDPCCVQMLEALTYTTKHIPCTRDTLLDTHTQQHGMDTVCQYMLRLADKLLEAHQLTCASSAYSAALEICSRRSPATGALASEHSIHLLTGLIAAHTSLCEYEQAIKCIQQLLTHHRARGDVHEECKLYGQLAGCYISQRQLKTALAAYKHQLVLASRLKQSEHIARALSSIGIVHRQLGQYEEALAAHRRALREYEQQQHPEGALAGAHELGNIGCVYACCGRTDTARDCHSQHLRAARRLQSVAEQMCALTNLAALECTCGKYQLARELYVEALSHTPPPQPSSRHKSQPTTPDPSITALQLRIYSGLGHVSRYLDDLQQALEWHEQQLCLSSACSDRSAESRACLELATIHQLLGRHETALSLYSAHLARTPSVSTDHLSAARVLTAMGTSHHALGQHQAALKCFTQLLHVAGSQGDTACECEAYLSMAVTWQALGDLRQASVNYRHHVRLCRERQDADGEMKATLNLAMCLDRLARKFYAASVHPDKEDDSASEEKTVETAADYHKDAVHHYNCCMELADRADNATIRSRVLGLLGYSHFSVREYAKAITYYERFLASNSDNKFAIGTAYHNMGLAFFALDKIDRALECQQMFYVISSALNSASNMCRALDVLGKLCSHAGRHADAISHHTRQLNLLKSDQHRTGEVDETVATAETDTSAGSSPLSRDSMLIAVYASLGEAHQRLGQYDKALGYYNQELVTSQEAGNLETEWIAHGHIGTVHFLLENFSLSIKSFEEQLSIANSLCDHTKTGSSHNTLGRAKMRLSQYEAATRHFRAQLHALCAAHGTASPHTAQCVRCHYWLITCAARTTSATVRQLLTLASAYLSAALQVGSSSEQARAYCFLGTFHKFGSDLQQAVLCLEKSLVLFHETNDIRNEAHVYGELSVLHMELGKSEQALSCATHKLCLAKELNNPDMESLVYIQVGNVFRRLNNIEEAFINYKHALDIANDKCDNSLVSQCVRVTAETHSMIGQIEEALDQWNLFRKLAPPDSCDQAQALLYIGCLNESRPELQQALELASSLHDRVLEVKILHEMAALCWRRDKLDCAQVYLNRCVSLSLEVLSRDVSPEVSSLTPSCGSDGQFLFPSVRRQLTDICRRDSRLLEMILVHMKHHEEALLRAESHRDGTHTCSPSGTVNRFVNRHNVNLLYYSWSLDNHRLHTWLLTPRVSGVACFHSAPLRVHGLLAQLYSRLNSCDPRGYQPAVTADDTEDELCHGVGRLMRNTVLSASSYSLASLLSTSSSLHRVTGHTSPAADKLTAPCAAEDGLQEICEDLYQDMVAPFASRLDNHKPLYIVCDVSLYAVPFSLVLHKKHSFPYIALGSSVKQLARVSDRHTLGEDLPCLLVHSDIVAPIKNSPLGVHFDWIADRLNTESHQSVNSADQLFHDYLATDHYACVHLHLELAADGLLFARDSPANDGVSQRCVLPPETIINRMPSVAIRLLVLSLTLDCCAKADDEPMFGHEFADRACSVAESFIALGATVVLVNTQPVNDHIKHLVYSAFYTSLMQGCSTCKCFQDALNYTQEMITGDCSGGTLMSLLSGFRLIGADVRLNSNYSLTLRTLMDLMSCGTTLHKCTCTRHTSRVTMRVCLHLIEKSLQRIRQRYRGSMYTSCSSIMAKIESCIHTTSKDENDSRHATHLDDSGSCEHWRILLKSLGFRFRFSGGSRYKADAMATDSAQIMFFPQADPSSRLSECSHALKCLLCLPERVLDALTSLERHTPCVDVVHEIGALLHVFSRTGTTVDHSLSLDAWHSSGCHELIASLDVDLLHIGSDRISFRLDSSVNRRHVTAAHQLLTSVIEPLCAVDSHYVYGDQNKAPASSSTCNEECARKYVTCRTQTVSCLSPFLLRDHSVLETGYPVSSGLGACEVAETAGEQLSGGCSSTLSARTCYPSSDWWPCPLRGEADAKSMTDSNYSSYSPPGVVNSIISDYVITNRDFAAIK